MQLDEKEHEKHVLVFPIDLLVHLEGEAHEGAQHYEVEHGHA